MDTRRLFAIKLHKTVHFYQQRASASTLLATRAAKWAACFPLAGADPEEQHVTIAYVHLREYVSARRCDVHTSWQYAAEWAAWPEQVGRCSFQGACDSCLWEPQGAHDCELKTVCQQG